MFDSSLIAALCRLVGEQYVIVEPEQRLVYECDAFTLVRRPPGLVVLPETVEQVAGVVKLLASRGVPIVPRGAGTGLAGGTVAHDDTVVIGVNRMTRIRRVDLRNRFAEVEAGLINARLSRVVAQAGLHFAPDPSSQAACTIGGNVATNAGGPHTLKYGVTVNHVLGVELVTPNGEILRTGADADDPRPARGPDATVSACAALDSPCGLDLTGVIVGSEGTFGVITAATVRLTRLPEAVQTALAVFESIDDATRTVSAIVAAGIVPAAMEMMDHGVIQAVEAAFGVGLPLDAGAVLIIEVDGPAAGLERSLRDVVGVCERNRARSVRVAANDDERAALWKSRKRAAGAFGRLASSYCTQDGVVPRSMLPDMLREIAEIGRRHDLRIANLIHAGDGNIHPILLYDERDAAQIRRVLAASHEILAACIRRGGTVTGEHGIGVEKIDFVPMLFTPAELRVFKSLRAVFDPDGRCNPGKLLPDSKRCWEVQTPGKRAAV